MKQSIYPAGTKIFATDKHPLPEGTYIGKVVDKFDNEYAVADSPSIVKFEQPDGKFDYVIAKFPDGDLNDIHRFEVQS